MPPRKRRSSACITLVLIGTAALSACGDDEANRRRQYRTLEECLADWGDPSECREEVARGSSGPHAYYHYYAGTGGSRSGGWWSGGSGSGSSAAGHDISRGGFGSSGHAHAAGG